MDKRLLICAHERSGSEWLIASIIKNLFPELYQPDATRQASWDVDGDLMFCDPKIMREFLLVQGHQRNKVIYGNEKTQGIVNGTDHRIPFKSHHAVHFFDPIWDEVIEKCHVIYLFRDGRDVMTSMWRHGWNKHGFMPRAYNVRQFIELQPTEAMGRYHGGYPVDNMAERWARHIARWEERKGVLYISYEQLSFLYADTIKRVANYLETEITSTIVNPGMVGVSPWKGQIGNWRTYSDPEDWGLFGEYASYAMRLLKEHNDLYDLGWTPWGS